MAIVYQHRKPGESTPFYIGIGKTKKRAYSKQRRNPHWHAVVNKCNYKIDITHTDVIWEEACAIERYLIAFWGRKDLGLGPLVNMTDGGDGVNNPSNEARKKISDIHTGKNFSEEHKKKLSIAKTGKNNPMFGRDKSKENNPMFGKQHSEETRKKISAANTGKILSEEHRKKMSAALTGKYTGKNHPMFGKQHSKATIKKLSDASAGENNPMFGRTGENSPGAKTAIIEYASGKSKTFTTRNEAASYLNVSSSHLSNIISGRCKLLRRFIDAGITKIYYKQ